MSFDSSSREHMARRRRHEVHRVFGMARKRREGTLCDFPARDSLVMSPLPGATHLLLPTKRTYHPSPQAPISAGDDCDWKPRLKRERSSSTAGEFVTG